MEALFLGFEDTWSGSMKVCVNYNLLSNMQNFLIISPQEALQSLGIKIEWMCV